MSRALRKVVFDRAQECCEYCQMPQALDKSAFHLDHIRALKHNGPTELENLALCCPACSLYKGANVAGYDPVTGVLTELFNPRLQTWSEHFVWETASLKGLTPTGRTTIEVLRVNDADNVALRNVLIELGKFPPRL